MPRYIIECEDPNDIILGMKCVKSMMGNPDSKDEIFQFTNGSVWYVRRTKTGFSARSWTKSEET